MDLYILDSQFRKSAVIDEYLSAIWTERYSDSGDITVTVAATAKNRALLVEGAFVSILASSEVMQVDTQDVQGNVLKVTGPTLDKVFESRVILPSDTLDQKSIPYTDNAGAVLNSLVQTYATAAGWTALHGAALPLSVDGAKQVLPNLVIGAEAAGPVATYSVTRGPLYDEIKKHGQVANIGWQLIPINVTPSSYSLEFSTWAGVDRTSDQAVNPIVRFSTVLESLADIKELRSKAKYRTVAYAITPDFDPTTLPAGSPYTGKAYAYPTAQFETGWARRVLLVEVSGVTAEAVNDSLATYQAVMDSHARDALANNNFTKVVDGEVVPQSQYTFGVDYDLGDIVELQDATGYIQKARITEYIRTKDEKGTREYPTVSVIE